MQQNKKQKFCTLPATHFFKPVGKASSNSDADKQKNNFDLKLPAADIDYLADCPFFKTCEPGVRYDIALILGHIREISDAVKVQILTCRDYLPKEFRFPLNNDASPRRCSFELLDRYPFLRYSPSVDGVFCVNCLFFSNETTPKRLHLRPASDWSNISRDCKAHSEAPKHNAGLKACPHLLCSQQAENFVSIFMGQQVGIAERLDEHRKIQIEKNRHILVQILKLIHRLGKQNLAIRGKTDERSNFHVFLNEHDDILSQHLKSASFRKTTTGKQVRGTYISHRIQEEFISLIGDHLEQRIIDRVKKAMFFSILVDECRDSSGKEQMSVFFRYVWKNTITGKYSVHEDFTTFLHCPRTSGEALFTVLMGGEDGGYTGRKGIPMENGRGLGSDGGGNMAGKQNGLQAHVRRAYPKMHFHWCDGHCLNLCVGKACGQPLVKKVVDHVQQVTIAFEYSAKRQQFFKEAIDENQTTSQDLGEKKKLTMLSETRWSARSAAFSTIKEGMFPLIRTLEKLEDENDEKANGLLTVILQFYFIVVLYIVASALAVVNILSDKLQYETLDLNDAADYAKVCKSQLQNWLQEAQQDNDEVGPPQTQFDKLYYDACQMALGLGVDESWPRVMQRRPQEKSKYTNLKDFFRKTIFVPFLEEMLFQLDTRLVQSEPHFRATWLLPSKMDFSLSDGQIVDKIVDGLFCADSAYYDDLLEHGNIPSSRFEVENWVSRWRLKPEAERPKQILACINSVNMDLYPNIKVICVHFLTLPVTTCSVERSFSELRRLKTWLRSTMTDTRLSALALMHFNYDLEIPYEDLIKKWSQFKSRLITLDVAEWIENEEEIL